jgi:zinc protease
VNPPVTSDLPVYKLPPIVETRFDNGLTVLLIEDRRFPLVTARLGFPAGSKFDPAKLAGLSETTAALLTEGTGRRSAREIAENVTAIGGSLHADSSADSLVVAGSALSENLPKLLGLMAECVTEPCFPEEEVALRKRNRKQELIVQRADAAYLADEKFAQVLFGPHPYARQDPTPESIDRLEREAFVEFRRTRLAPSDATLVLLGSLPSAGRVLELIAAKFGLWLGKDSATPPAAEFPEPRRTVTLVDRPGSVEADIRIGRRGVTRSDPDYFPLLVGNTILGGGASSRLFTIVREQMGFAYDVHSTVQSMRDSGWFATVTQVRNEVIGEALDALIAQSRRMAAELVTPAELETAKNYLSGVFVIRLETQEGLANQLIGLKLMGLPLDYLEKYTARVRAVSAAEIRDAAARYMDPSPASVVVVGDEGKLAQALGKYGDVAIEKTK